jgi:hypothetical protein
MGVGAGLTGETGAHKKRTGKACNAVQLRLNGIFLLGVL